MKREDAGRTARLRPEGARSRSRRFGGLKVEVFVARGMPCVRFVCAACGRMEVCDWKRLKPGSTLICYRCGRRLTLSRDHFNRIAGAIALSLRLATADPANRTSDPYDYPRLWVG